MINPLYVAAPPLGGPESLAKDGWFVPIEIEDEIGRNTGKSKQPYRRSYVNQREDDEVLFMVNLFLNTCL